MSKTKIEPDMLFLTPRKKPTMVIESFTGDYGEVWWVLLDHEGKFNAKENVLRKQIRLGLFEVINEAR